jgi:hypothetical protein
MIVQQFNGSMNVVNENSYFFHQLASSSTFNFEYVETGSIGNCILVNVAGTAEYNYTGPLGQVGVGAFMSIQQIKIPVQEIIPGIEKIETISYHDFVVTIHLNIDH